jgi:parvulin-like peptidyl-prolyl cis-trans isomerase-like protein
MKWLRDPLVVFLLVGAGLFFIAQWFGEEDIPYHIDVGEQDLKRLSDQWTMQMRRPPSPQELSGLVEQFVKEEVYYREAQRLGLDTNDTIVRRRMVQKLTFLTEDIATAGVPTETELQAYYDQHLDNYRLPQRISFRHRYFSVDRRDDARTDAQLALTNPDATGDPFMLQREYALRSAREIRDLFGRSFAEQLMALEASDKWQGPIQSAYGWHPVMVTNKVGDAVEPFAQVRERVIIDMQQAAREEANRKYYADLKSRYTVSYPEND